MTTFRLPTLRGVLAALALLPAVLLAVLLARPAPAHGAPVPGEWQLPLPGAPPVLRPFDPPAEKWNAGHRGVDLAAAVGTDVLAAGSGTVTFSGQVAGRGVVSIEHGDRRTTYQPVHPTVRPGQTVHAGQAIGTISSDSHCGSRSCLHWGLIRGDRYLDPMTLLRAPAPRLLPVWGIPPGAAATADPTTTPTWRRAGDLGRRPSGSPAAEPARPDDHPGPPALPVGALAGTAGVATVGAFVGYRTRRSRPVAPSRSTASNPTSTRSHR